MRLAVVLVISISTCHCSTADGPYGAAFVRDAVTNQPICDATVAIDGGAATPFKPVTGPCYYGAYRRLGDPPKAMTVRVTRPGYYDVELETTATQATVVLDPVP